MSVGTFGLGQISLAPLPLEITSLFSTKGFTCSSWKTNIVIVCFFGMCMIITERVGYF